MIDCPVYQAQLKYDIEHIDEIKDVVYRISLKNRFGIPRNEKDQKDLDDYTADLKKAEETEKLNTMRPKSLKTFREFIEKRYQELEEKLKQF